MAEVADLCAERQLGFAQRRAELCEVEGDARIGVQAKQAEIASAKIEAAQLIGVLAVDRPVADQ